MLREQHIPLQKRSLPMKIWHISIGFLLMLILASCAEKDNTFRDWIRAHKNGNKYDFEQGFVTGTGNKDRRRQPDRRV
jgi:hypothetical protein